MRLEFQDLADRYNDTLTSSITASCAFVTPMAGGVPAGIDGLRLFVTHHLGITDEAEAEKATQRIMKEEIGDRAVPSAEGEIQERMTYGVNVIRRTPRGPWIGTWMVKACLKVAASRLDIFREKRGSKGDMVEAGRVSPYGISALDPPEDVEGCKRIYLIGPDDQPATTTFEEFKGRVNSPKGSVSIVHHSECVPAGTRFEFQFQFLSGKIKEDDLKDMAALSMIVGLGSVKALDLGKFRINWADLEMGHRKNGKKDE